MPVLARIFEAAGMSTVLITNMPFWSERIGVPRALAVEFPFGHVLGLPHELPMQMRVIEQALAVLETAPKPGSIIHSPEQWPTSLEEALQRSRPATPPPIRQHIGRHIGKFLRALRRNPA